MTIDIITIIGFCLLLLTGIGIIVYDFKIQLIPIVLIINNYILSIFFVTKFSVLYSCVFGVAGIIVILLFYYKKWPIDVLFVAVLVSFILIYRSKWHIIPVAVVFLYMFLPFKKIRVNSKDSEDDSRVSFMVPLELAIIIDSFLLMKGIIQ